LEAINNEKGLGFDDWDLDYYTNLFREKLCRNPSDVEVFSALCLSLSLTESSASTWPNQTVNTLATGSLEGK
jgi:hypothetical protein